MESLKGLPSWPWFDLFLNSPLRKTKKDTFWNLLLMRQTSEYPFSWNWWWTKKSGSTVVKSMLTRRMNFFFLSKYNSWVVFCMLLNCTFVQVLVQSEYYFQMLWMRWVYNNSWPPPLQPATTLVSWLLLERAQAFYSASICWQNTLKTLLATDRLAYWPLMRFFSTIIFVWRIFVGVFDPAKSTWCSICCQLNTFSDNCTVFSVPTFSKNCFG